MFNPLLGKSYGEIAALSRSQHKSQGFGVPAQRGASLEYFKTIKGNTAVNDLMEGISTGWDRSILRKRNSINGITQASLQESVDSLIQQFDAEHPEKMVWPLTELYKSISTLSPSYLKTQKLTAISQLIEACSGLFIEATALTQLNTIGDSIKITFSVNNRLGAPFDKLKIQCFDSSVNFTQLEKNQKIKRKPLVVIFRLQLLPLNHIG
jgi:hypothetical protein